MLYRTGAASHARPPKYPASPARIRATGRQVPAVFDMSNQLETVLDDVHHEAWKERELSACEGEDADRIDVEIQRPQYDEPVS